MENPMVNKFKKSIEGKKIAVVGVGVSNTPLIEFLLTANAKITAFDKATKEKLIDVYEKYTDKGVTFKLGEDYLDGLDKGFDYIFRTPGLHPQNEHLVKAIKNGAILTSEMEVFMELCPSKVFAVTGSDGKTTTTSIIYNLLKEEGYKCWLGGNIGTPLLNKVEEMTENDLVVLELSSFQLSTMTKSAEISVITNLSPNHLDIHKSMEEYVEAKKNIFINQKTQNVNMEPLVVLNFDNQITKEFASIVIGKYRYFSRLNSLKDGVFVKNNKIVLIKNDKEIEVVECSKISIPGVHNVENYMAAFGAVMDFVKIETMRKVAENFKGVAHRIELVREFKGVKFYNDSIASSPSRTIAGLNSFEKKVILITGGRDKKVPFDELGPVLAKKVKTLVLIGETASKIEKALEDEISKTGDGKEVKKIHVNNYKDAIESAFKEAKSGDVVLLSPASTSFDMFKNFEERGNTFKKLVLELK